MQKSKSKRTKRSQSFLRSYAWKKLRVDVLNRDGCECQLCGCREHLNCHHILYRKFYPDYRLDAMNVITVCDSCHFQIHKGVGNFKLLEWLRQKRKDVYDWIMERV